MTYIIRRWMRWDSNGVIMVTHPLPTVPFCFSFCFSFLLIENLPTKSVGFLGGSKRSAYCDARCDPFHLGAVEQLVRDAKVSAAGHPTQKQLLFGRPRKQRTDSDNQCYSVFEQLPPEILNIILENLPTPDVFSLWLASSIVPDQLPPSFWKSRFAKGMDFGHLFEAMDLWDTPHIDWYDLFFKVKGLLSTPANFHIRNRRRTLLMIDAVAKLMSKYVERPVEGIDYSDIDPVLLETDGIYIHKKLVTMPRPAEISTICISTLQSKDKEYVTGVRVNHDNGCVLGYFHEPESLSFSVDPSSDTLSEIGCYMDKGGVRGLYFTTETGRRFGMHMEPEVDALLSCGILPLGKHLIGHFDVKITIPFVHLSNLFFTNVHFI